MFVAVFFVLFVMYPSLFLLFVCLYFFRILECDYISLSRNIL